MIQTLPQWAETAGTVFVSAGGTSVAFWLANRRGTGESFDPERAGATIGVAFALSVVFLATGQATGRVDLLAQLAPLVGPLAAMVQEVYQRYRRTGNLDLTSDEVDEAISTLITLFDHASATPPVTSASASGPEPEPEPDTATIDEPKQIPEERSRRDEAPSTDGASFITGPTPADEAQSLIATAGYQDLRAVAGEMRTINGNQSEDVLRTRLTDAAEADGERVLRKFEAAGIE